MIENKEFVMGFLCMERFNCGNVHTTSGFMWQMFSDIVWSCRRNYKDVWGNRLMQRCSEIWNDLRLNELSACYPLHISLDVGVCALTAHVSLYVSCAVRMNPMYKYHMYGLNELWITHLQVFVLHDFSFKNNRIDEQFLRMMESSQSLQGQYDAVTWFAKSQQQSVIRDGIVPEWFHGIISRK